MCKTSKNTSDQRTENEIAHGKYLAANDPPKVWNWDSPAGRVRWERRKNMLLGQLNNGNKVLEIGCGTGLLTSEIGKMNVRLTVIDISVDLLEIARKNNASTNTTFLLEDAANMSFDDGSFDIIIGSSVFHHLDVGRATSEFFRVLKPGGKMVFTEPNMLNPQIALQKNWPYLKKRMGDSPDETAFIRWNLHRQLKRSGFIQVEITPFDFMHPSLPEWLINPIDNFLEYLEKVPVVKEIAGSLFIRAIK